jgi:hypothetical protein
VMVDMMVYRSVAKKGETMEEKWAAVSAAPKEPLTVAQKDD